MFHLVKWKVSESSPWQMAEFYQTWGPRRSRWHFNVARYSKEVSQSVSRQNPCFQLGRWSNMDIQWLWHPMVATFSWKVPRRRLLSSRGTVCGSFPSGFGLRSGTQVFRGRVSRKAPPRGTAGGGRWTDSKAAIRARQAIARVGASTRSQPPTVSCVAWGDVVDRSSIGE